MNYSYEQVGANLLFTVYGELTMFNVSRLAEGIARAVEENRLRNVIIDAEGLNLIDSAAFGYLLKHNALLQEKGGWIRFVALSPRIRSALAQLHLDETLKEYPSLQEALATPIGQDSGWSGPTG